MAAASSAPTPQAAPQILDPSDSSDGSDSDVEVHMEDVPSMKEEKAPTDTQVPADPSLKAVEDAVSQDLQEERGLADPFSVVTAHMPSNESKKIYIHYHSFPSILISLENA